MALTIMDTKGLLFERAQVRVLYVLTMESRYDVIVLRCHYYVD